MPTCTNCGAAVPEDAAHCPACFRRVAVDLDALAAAATLADARPAPASPTSLALGSTFADRYRVDEFLGRGGMGSVFKVTDTVTGKVAALKLLSADLSSEPGFAARFAREVQLLARIQHPSIPKVMGAGVADKTPYFLSEYISGRTLRAEIERLGRLSVPRAAILGAGIAEALAAAHAQGVVHRDVKPHNVMIDAADRVFLIDFGLARGAGPDLKSLTQTGMLLGTPHYMAPEQIESQRADERSDLYSLGVVLFEMVTGDVPFPGDTPFSVAQHHLHDAPPRLRTVRRDIPAWYEQLVLRCLEKVPTRRPWTAGELAAVLRTPHSDGPRRRKMANGDWVDELPVGSSTCPLRIRSRSERVGWTPGIALHFEKLLYRLAEIAPPESHGARWEYRFEPWPSEEILRRLVDYEVESATTPEPEASLWSRVRSVLGAARP